MIIIEVFSDLIREPIRFACIPRGLFAYSIGVVVRDDEAPVDAIRYSLYVSSRKADINRIAEFYQLHYTADGEGCGIPLAENWDSLGIDTEIGTFGSLTTEELLLPLLIDELHPKKRLPVSHWYH